MSRQACLSHLFWSLWILINNVIQYQVVWFITYKDIPRRFFTFGSQVPSQLNHTLVLYTQSSMYVYSILLLIAMFVFTSIPLGVTLWVVKSKRTAKASIYNTIYWKLSGKSLQALIQTSILMCVESIKIGPGCIQLRWTLVCTFERLTYVCFNKCIWTYQ